MPKKVITISSLRVMAIANNSEKLSRPTVTQSKTLIHMFKRNQEASLLMVSTSRAVRLSEMTLFSMVQLLKNHTLMPKSKLEANLLMDMTSKVEKPSVKISL